MKHIVSFSGGKDSTAMLLMMIEKGIKIDEIVFADTKLEFYEMYKYIDRIENHIKRKITTVRTKDEFDDWFYGKWTRGVKTDKIRGMPKSVEPCYWSRQAKYNLLEKICKGNFRYLGIASDEPKRIHYKDGYKYPLYEWGITEKQCNKYLKERDLVNPLYEKFDRLGCWLCPKQSIKSLKALYIHYPDKWEKLKQYECDSPGGFADKKDLKQLEYRFNQEIYMERNQIKMLV